MGVDILVILCEFGVDILFMIFLAEMITKFNQEIYAKLKARKNKPLTSIGQKQPRVTKEVIETIASTPRPKRARGNDKGKSKIDNVITPDELRILSIVPSHELVNRHVHKLIQILFYPNLLLLLSSLSLETILILFIFHYVLGEALPHLLVLSRALFYTGREA